MLLINESAFIFIATSNKQLSWKKVYWEI